MSISPLQGGFGGGQNLLQPLIAYVKGLKGEVARIVAEYIDKSNEEMKALDKVALQKKMQKALDELAKLAKVAEQLPPTAKREAGNLQDEIQAAKAKIKANNQDLA